jgi:hypothetical protein
LVFFSGATEEGEEMERQRRWRMGQRRRRGMRRKRVSSVVSSF